MPFPSALAAHSEHVRRPLRTDAEKERNGICRRAVCKCRCVRRHWSRGSRGVEADKVPALQKHALYMHSGNKIFPTFAGIKRVRGFCPQKRTKETQASGFARGRAPGEQRAEACKF